MGKGLLQRAERYAILATAGDLIVDAVAGAAAAIGTQSALGLGSSGFASEVGYGIAIGGTLGIQYSTHQ